MISHVISVWSSTWSVHDQPSDHWIFSLVITAWSTKWLVHDQPRDQCMISHVISVSCTDHEADHTLITWLCMHWLRGWSLGKPAFMNWFVFPFLFNWKKFLCWRESNQMAPAVQTSNVVSTKVFIQKHYWPFVFLSFSWLRTLTDKRWTS